MGNNDGEESDRDSKGGGAEKVACVDEGRRADSESARARESEDDCDRAEAQAERGCDATQGIDSWCDTGRRSREERSVMAHRAGTKR